MNDLQSIKQWISSQEIIGLQETDQSHLLEEFEQFFTYLFNSSRDGISILDNHLTILGVNNTMERWYEHKGNIVGQKCFQIYHNRNYPCDNCPTLLAIEEKKYTTCRVPYEGPEGVNGTQELCSFPIFNDENEVTGIIEYVRDITEIEKEEEVIENLKKRLRFQEQTLQEQEIALNVLIRDRAREEQKITGKIVRNLTHLIKPVIETMKVRLEGTEEILFLEVIESYLDDLLSPVSNQLSVKLMNLSSREMEVAELVKQGKTSKEIASLLGVTIKAVDFHRMNIRKKLNLTNQRVNLRSYLFGLENENPR